ncbi:hypothetical protein GCM10009808_00090 [Microbacterium sediminicola]|uniref:O-antigen ligase-related domain-containing protein n=1 Tax=Microbacterium sediminicola TaxID=415210 RepID=A0ABN2HFH9_9MICO
MEPKWRLFITRDAAAVVLIVLLWCRAVGQLIVLSLTAEKSFVAIGQDEVTSPAASLTSQGFFLLAIAFAVGVILFNINDITRPGLWRIMLVLAPWLWMVARDAYSGSASADSVLYVAVILALAALRPHPRILGALGFVVVLTAALAILFGFLLPDAGLLREADGAVRERSDKEILPGLGLLQGMFTSENNLGQYLSMGIAAVLMIPKWWQRCAGLAIVGFAIIWSASRSSLVTMVGVLAVGSVVWLIIEFRRRKLASIAARVAIGGSVLVMCALPLMGWSNDAFTARGQIWNGSLEEWSSRAFLFGLGREWYTQIAGTVTSPLNSAAYHGHNQFVQLLVTGGVVLGILAVAWLLVQAYAITEPTNRYLVITAILVVGIALGGLLEVPLGFVDRSAFWTVTVVPLAVFFFARPRDTAIPDTRIAIRR